MKVISDLQTRPPVVSAVRPGLITQITTVEILTVLETNLGVGQRTGKKTVT